MISDQEVLDFIHRRFPIDCNWTNGNCYYFAIILKSRFGGDIYYDTVVGHFYIRICNTNYDFRGTYTPIKGILFDDIKKNDKLWYDRLLDQCVN